jgi:hypothetical protein
LKISKPTLVGQYPFNYENSYLIIDFYAWQTIIIQKKTNQIDNQGHYFDYEIDHFIFLKFNIDNLCEPKFYYKNPPHGYKLK